MCTAKHNFCTDIGVEKYYEECYASLAIDQNNSSAVLKSKEVRSLMSADYVSRDDAFPLQDGATWKYGRDVATIPLENEPALQRLFQQGCFSSFDAVSEDFEIAEGMRVGIISCSATENLLIAKSIKNNYTNMQEGYEPQLLDIFLPVGEITFVGKDHIEYKINTFPGMSGAAVFILSDDGQHMKLIAIHAGYSEALETNFGFKITAESFQD